MFLCTTQNIVYADYSFVRIYKKQKCFIFCTIILICCKSVVKYFFEYKLYEKFTLFMGFKWLLF